MEKHTEIKKIVVLKKRFGEIRADKTRRFLKTAFRETYVPVDQFQQNLEATYGDLGQSAEETLRREGVIEYALSINGNIHHQSQARQAAEGFLTSGWLPQAKDLADALVYAEPSEQNEELYQRVMKQVLGSKKAARAATLFKLGMTHYNHRLGEDAIPYLRDAAKHDKKNDVITSVLAGILFYDTETRVEGAAAPKEALNLAKKAVKLNPQSIAHRDLERVIAEDRRKA